MEKKNITVIKPTMGVLAKDHYCYYCDHGVIIMPPPRRGGGGIKR